VSVKEIRDLGELYSDIVSAIDRVLSYTRDGREVFFADTKTQDAVVSACADR